MTEHKDKKVLVVEADQITRMGICAYLKEKRPDWSVFEAKNGYQAIEVADQEMLDYITIDYYLPGMNGLELIIELKRMHTAGKFILLTSPLPDHLKTEIEATAVKHMDKPIDEGVILTALKYFES